MMNYSMATWLRLPGFLILSMATLAGQAQTAQDKGLAIAQKAHLEGWVDYSASVEMTLTARNGQTATRELRYQTMETEDDGDLALTYFDRPKDVEGTTLLTHAHKVADDDVWLFLPALKRIKRIAGNNKSGPFMGSEFAFEDFGAQEVEKYRYRFLREERLTGEACLVVERYPVEKTSGYSRQVLWFDQAELRVRKIEYFNKGDVHFKTLTAGKYEQFLNQYYFPKRYEMVNHETGRSTVLQFSDYQFGNGYSRRDFDQSALKRAR